MERSSCRLQCLYILLFTSVVFVSGNIDTRETREPFSRGKVTRTRGRERPSVSTSVVTDFPHQNGKSINHLDSLLDMLLNKVWTETENKPKPLVYPYSGELIRLRGNDKILNSGLVEVYRAGQWGYVCDDRWDRKDATVACKQLGFTWGVLSVSDVNVTLSEIQKSSILMDDVQCFGTESSLHECFYNALNDCTLDEAAGVTCYADEGCPKGWISGLGKCYKFYTKAKTIKLAASRCARDNASLVTVDSIMENHFLSNIIKNSVPHVHQWYTGGKRMKNRKNRWQWNKYVSVSKVNAKKSRNRNKSKSSKAAFKTVKSAVSVDRWFPGWPSFNNKHAEPAGKKRHDCLTLSDVYTDPGTESSSVVDYFYWKADRCKRAEGIHFICQISPARQEKVGNQVCKVEQFKCKNDACVSAKVLCDKNDNCGDNSDEYDCQAVNFQLVNGSTPSEGRVEMTRNGFRGTVCDDDWDDKDAAVVCRKLGFIYGGQAIDNAFFGSGTGPIWLDNVHCSGNEVSLEQCPHAGWANHNCGHGEDAGVKCYDRPTTHSSTTTKETTRTTEATTRMSTVISSISSTVCKVEQFKCKNDVCVSAKVLCDKNDNCGDNSDEYDCQAINFQLVNGSTPSEGRVEVTRNGFRGTVCDDLWDDTDAAVVCRKLGFIYGGKAMISSFFGSGTGPIWLDNVNCSGNEVSLEQCPHAGWAIHNCVHGEDAGVKCYDKPTTHTSTTTMKSTRTTGATTQMSIVISSISNTATLQVRLVGGRDASEGNVEVVINNVSYRVCDDNWDNKDATVVCKMLGYSGGGVATTHSRFGSSLNSIILDEVNCTGAQTDLGECSATVGVTKHDCSSSELAGAVCDKDSTPTKQPNTSTTLQVRLVGGKDPSEGNVEVVINNVKYRVCDDNWDNKDATVVCKMLGYSGAGVATTLSRFGSDLNDIIFDEVNCTGAQTDLGECSAIVGVRIHDCTSRELAGAVCGKDSRPIRKPGTSTTLQVRLVGGRDPSEGNVEVVIDNVKYRVCDDNWDDTDATVICKMLGYSGSGIATTNSLFGSDLNDIILDEVNCDGTHTDLGECPAIVGVEKHNCNSSELAGAVCYKESPPTKQPGSSLINETFIAGTCGKRPYDHIDFVKPRINRYNPFTTILPNTPKYLETLQLTKVAGGNYAQHGAYPWQARVHQVFDSNVDGGVEYGKHQCGAAVISEFWLLSAAHCFIGRHKDELITVVGDHNLKITDVGEQTFQVEDIIMHEQYSNVTHENDIALIKIKPTREGRGVEFNNYVQPVCLPDSRTPFIEGTKCWTSGWGNLNPSGSISAYPNILNAAEVPLISQLKCERLYTKRMSYYLSQRMFCAGYIRGGIDSCHGDSGGPLVCKIADGYTVIGIASWGRGCAIANQPGIYTRVSAFAPWIDQNIRLYTSNETETTLPTKP